MAYTFNLAGTGNEKRIALVRDEIDDVANKESPVVGADYFVTDERIMARLTSAADEAPAGSVEVETRLMACASILETLATNQAYVIKVGRTLGEERDGAKVADAIRAHAKSCITRAEKSRKARLDAAAEVAANAALPVEPLGGNVPLVAVG